MKGISKKLLSILAAICLLASIALPAGLLTSAGTDNDPVVYAVDLTSAASFYTGEIGNAGNVYRAGGSDKVYTISFEYYMPETPSWPVTFGCQQNGPRQSGDPYLYAGYHTFEATWKGTSGGVFVPRVYAAAKDISELYIWNYTVTVEGAPVTPNGSEKVNGGATFTNDKKLSEYDWSAKMAESPAVTEITFGEGGAQSWGRGHYTAGTDANTLYELSFDYYVPAACDTLTVNCATGRSPTTVSGSLAMDKTEGVHHFSWTGYNGSAGKFYPRIKGTVGQTLYIWNYSFKVGGEVTTPKNVSETPSTAPAVGGKLLCQYDWSSPFVTEITFPGESGTSKWSLPDGRFYYGGVSEATAYTITFDYYLPEAVDSLVFNSVSGYMNGESAHKNMEKSKGHHTYTWTTYTDHFSGGSAGQFVPYIQAPAGTELYLWNWSVKQNGAELKATGTGWSPDTTGTVGGRLNTYDWAKYMDMPYVTEVTFIDDGKNDGASNYSPKNCWYYGGSSAETPYTISFDYYLPETVGGIRFYSVSGGMTTVSGGTMDRTAGIHHFEWVTHSSETNGQLVTAIESVYGAKMYIWNWSVKVNGVEVAGVAGEWNGQTNGTLGKQLHEYEWSGLGGEEPPAEPVDSIAYVDYTNGDDAAAAVGDEAKPYKTINAAITALDALTGNVNRIIKIVGTYTMEDKVSSQKAFATHTNLITIVGSADGAVLNPSGTVNGGGPLKFDNITLLFNNNTSEFRFGGHEVEFGAGVTTSYTTTGVGYLTLGGYYNFLKTLRATGAYKLTVNGGEFNSIRLADGAVPVNNVYEIAGVDFVMNGGSTKSLTLGNANSSGHNGVNKYTDNVNIVVNGGTVDTFTIKKYASFADGVAVQAIFNNGIAPTVTVADGVTVPSLYVVKVAANDNGTYLSTTDTVGVYKLNRLGDFEPIVKDASDNTVENAFDAESGTITLPAAGKYSVIWEEIPIDPIVTEITFPANGDKATSRWNPTPFWYFGGDSEENAYEVSFEYFLYEEVGSLNFDSVSGKMKTVEGSRSLSTDAGYHKVYWKTWTTVKRSDTQTGQFVPYIEAPVGAKMYIWNWSVKINGEKIEGWNTNEAAGQTKGEIGDPLSTYPWYDGMENWHGDPTNPLVTKVDLSAGNKWYVGEFRDSAGSLDQYVWDLEFEYFLPERIDINFSNGPGWMSILEGSPKIEVGHHTVKLKLQVTKYEKTQKIDEATGEPMVDPDTGEPVYKERGANQNAFIPIFANTSAHDGELYVWNLKVKLNGEDYKLNKFNATESAPQAPLDASKKLKEYPWHEYMDTVVDTTPPDVLELDFTKGDCYAFCITRMANHSPEHPYEISFDYYLPEECAGASLVMDSLSGSNALIGGDAPYFVTGHHKFHGIYRTSAAGNTFAPFLKNKEKFGKLYIWNFKLTIDGQEVQSATAEIERYITAGVDNTKRLNEFDWSETMDSVPVVKNKTEKSRYMLKIENYYFDVETSQTLKDQQFRQLVGLAEDYETGTPILPNRTYVFSFDYYSDSNLGSDLRVWHMHSGSGKANTSFKIYGSDKTVNEELEYDGRYHVSTEFTTWPGQYDISVGLDVGVDGIGYYWNFSLIDKETGEEMLRNTELVRPANPEENGRTFANWITNSAEKDFSPNFTWLPMDSDEAKTILALKEGETLPDDEEEEEVEEEEEEEKDETEDKINPLGPDTLFDPNYDIAMDYADASGFGVGYTLDIYPYADGELAEAILEKLGDLPYKAYDIQLVFDDAFIQPEKDIFLAIGLPEGFNPDTTKVYFCDAYGNLIDTAAYVDGGYLLLQYNVLGTFVIVDGDVESVGTQGDGEQEPTDDPNEGDTPADTDPDDGKDDKKDKNGKSNSWILWVAIGGGVILLAAAAVVILVILKKKGAKPTAE